MLRSFSAVFNDVSLKWAFSCLLVELRWADVKSQNWHLKVLSLACCPLKWASKRDLVLKDLPQESQSKCGSCRVRFSKSSFNKHDGFSTWASFSDTKPEEIFNCSLSMIYLAARKENPTPHKLLHKSHVAGPGRCSNKLTGPDTRQDSSGWLGRIKNAKTTRN